MLNYLKCIFGLSYKVDIVFQSEHEYFDPNNVNCITKANPVFVKIEKCSYCGKERAYYIQEFGVTDNKKHWIDIDVLKIKCKKSIEEARKQK